MDYPHSTKAKKYFLMLNAGFTEETTKELVMPKGIEDNDEEKVDVMGGNGKKDKRKFREREQEHTAFKGKDWIMHKKDRMRSQVRFCEQWMCVGQECQEGLQVHWSQTSYGPQLNNSVF